MLLFGLVVIVVATDIVSKNACDCVKEESGEQTRHSDGNGTWPSTEKGIGKSKLNVMNTNKTKRTKQNQNESNKINHDSIDFILRKHAKNKTKNEKPKLSFTIFVSFNPCSLYCCLCFYFCVLFFFLMFSYLYSKRWRRKCFRCFYFTFVHFRSVPFRWVELCLQYFSKEKKNWIEIQKNQTKDCLKEILK